MKMGRKRAIISLVATATLAGTLLVGCGNSTEIRDTVVIEEIYQQVDASQYYYDQLSNESKEIYNNICKATEQIINNESVIVGKIPGNKKTISSNTYDIVGEAFNACMLDHPLMSVLLDDFELFLELNDVTEEEFEQQDIFTFDVVMYPSEETGRYSSFESTEKLVEAVEELEKRVNSFVKKLRGSDEQKLLQIHDWLLEDATYNADNGSIHMHDIYGAIIEKACVCDGFSYAFKYVADMADIPVITVIGTGVTSNSTISNDDEYESIKTYDYDTTINHAWNNIYLDGEWKLVDVTWDLETEPIMKLKKISLKMDGGIFGDWYIVKVYEQDGFGTGHEYFNVPLEETKKTHIPSDFFDTPQ